MVYYDKLDDPGPQPIQEYWVNVYAWFNQMTGKYQQFVGIGPTQCFPTRNDAAFYQPSIGLEIHYRIHVKLKPVNPYKPEYKNLNKLNWMG